MAQKLSMPPRKCDSVAAVNSAAAYNTAATEHASNAAVNSAAAFKE
jgi:hypothetical protein